MEAQPLPRVTPYLLRRADSMCARRLSRAFSLARCSFVLTRPGEDQGRVIAELENGHVEPPRLDLSRYPEIAEAVRTRRPMTMPDVQDAASPESAPRMACAAPSSCGPSPKIRWR